MVFYSLVLDESTDIRDTAQLEIFIRGINQEYEVVEELLDLYPMKGTTKGLDVYNALRKSMASFGLENFAKCFGAPSMTGRTNGLVALKKQEAEHDIVV